MSYTADPDLLAGRIVQRSTDELLAGLALVREAPRHKGRLELIVTRPEEGARNDPAEAELSTDAGLVGDNWLARGSRHTDDGSAEVGRQITVMNAAAAQLFAGDRSLWGVAGDQLYVDLDISIDNLPPGTQVRIGDAVLEVSVEPHTGCAKFLARFGRDASRLVGTETGKQLRLRGLNASVVRAGTIRVGDPVEKL